jgi:predicted Zn-dependent peptidase
VIGAQIVPGKTEREVRTVIDATLQQLASTGGTPEQLTRARNQYLLQSYSGLENADTLGSTIGEALMSSDNYMRGFESLEEAKKVTNADIKRVASTYFTDENSTTVLITPKDKK